MKKILLIGTLILSSIATHQIMTITSEQAWEEYLKTKHGAEQKLLAAQQSAQRIGTRFEEGARDLGKSFSEGAKGIGKKLKFW